MLLNESLFEKGQNSDETKRKQMLDHDSACLPFQMCGLAAKIVWLLRFVVATSQSDDRLELFHRLKIKKMVKPRLDLKSDWT